MIPRRIEGMQKFQSSTFPSKYGWFMLCIVVLSEILKQTFVIIQLKLELLSRTTFLVLNEVVAFESVNQILINRSSQPASEVFVLLRILTPMNVSHGKEIHTPIFNFRSFNSVYLLREGLADLIKIISQKKTAKILLLLLLLIIIIIIIITIIINLPSSFKSYLQPQKHYEKNMTT